MSLIVQKFGGTSVADCEQIQAAARKAVRAHQQGHQVVMVVSAMGKNTDQLIELARDVNPNPPDREMDMLLSTGEQVSVALMAMAIDAMGYEAVSLTGGQIGIRTDSSHTKARIRSISTDRMRELLDAGNIVIAAGFQGMDEDWNITTLGRGGSDTTAVALAAVLGADLCEIYTDVDGVYTTDPRLLPEARQMSRISYEEMLELASLGAGVMHNRSVEFAKKFSVPIYVRSSLSDAAGTLIAGIPESRTIPVSGAALTKNEARITVIGVPDVPGTSLEIFSRIASFKISVDMLVQNIGASGKADISFTVPAHELLHALKSVRESAQIVGADEVIFDEDVAKVSVVGLEMARQTAVADKMFQALADGGVNIQMITTSEIKISALIARKEAQQALRVVHQAFGLDQPPDDAERIGHLPPIEAGIDRDETSSPAEIVARLRDFDMEELTIHEVAMDNSQARVSIQGVPDQPGVASQVFRQVAKAGVFVDLIVQSYHGEKGRTGLSFSVPRDSVKTAYEACQELSTQLGFKEINYSPRVCKLLVSGIGLRSHTSVSARMFKALAQANINVEMISTSEVRVNMVVAGEQGNRGLEALQAAFKSVKRM